MNHKEISLPLNFEHFLTGMFGNKYHHYVGSCDFRYWKKINQQISKSIRSSIRYFVTRTDPKHKDELDKTCQYFVESIDKSKSIDDINVQMIRHLTEICYLLIGKLPNNYFKDNPNVYKYWKLNEFRDVVYTQTPDQKYHLIIREIEKKGQVDGLPTVKALIDKFASDFKCNSTLFVNWFKREYPAIYLEIF